VAPVGVVTFKKTTVVGGGSVIFKENVYINGLVYSHDDITAEKELHVRGGGIAYI
jgi:hypothetical protein|tara:strand:+ start:474 stop:638 length:165 start_codon:yes stop_codon:yes gene_type:complete